MLAHDCSLISMPLASLGGPRDLAGRLSFGGGSGGGGGGGGRLYGRVYLLRPGRDDVWIALALRACGLPGEPGGLLAHAQAFSERAIQSGCCAVLVTVGDVSLPCEPTFAAAAVVVELRRQLLALAVRAGGSGATAAARDELCAAARLYTPAVATAARLLG
jgi:hypothetical protein